MNIPSPEYGIDIAKRRADDLDRKMLKAVQSADSPQVLDIGCGAGGHSVRLALAGARVVGVDIENYCDDFKKARQEHSLRKEQLTFVHGDIHKAVAQLEQQFSYCCLQRVLHYVPYVAAVTVLEQLRQRVTQKLYLSLSGLDSAIGETYADKKQPVTKRFCQLDAATSRTFGIKAPLCLYTQQEVEKLLVASGWEVEEVWVSAFGNIKCVAE